MKICYLADANSVHTKKWCEFFNKKGYEIFVISLGDGEIENTKVYSFGVEDFNTKGHLSKFFTYFTKSGMTKEIIRKENPDIIHAHYATSYGMLASLIGIHPYILSVWGSDVYDFPNSGFLQRKLLERNLKKADILFSTSKAMKIETKKYTNKDIEVTPFGVDIDIYKPIEVKRLSKFTVGTIKSFYSIYGIEYLIQGYCDFLKEINTEDSILILGGKGPQEGELRELVNKLGIEDKVRFLGFLTQDEVIKAFNQMDVAVFPSIVDESFGVAAVEAGACGVPTIVSDAGGLPEATKPGYSSIKVPKKDSHAITEALVKLYNEEKLRNQMKENARKFVIDNYNLEDNFNYVDEIYKKIAIK